MTPNTFRTIKVNMHHGNPFISRSIVYIQQSAIWEIQLHMHGWIRSEFIHTLEDIGTKQYQGFVNCEMEECSISIHDPIKKNSLAIFKPPQARVASKQGKKIKVLQNNVALLGQLYISMQSREGDVKEFFSHEIHLLYLTLESSICQILKGPETGHKSCGHLYS